MGDFFRQIYRQQADQYHRLIAAEDVDEQLLPALEKITAVQGKRVLDLGSGTGRFTLLLAPLAAEFIALDLHEGMLREQQKQQAGVNGRWPLLQGDIRQLPLQDGWADVITVGWAMGHFQSWFAPEWRPQVERALREMMRVLRPQGTLIIAETLGTGTERPGPPSEGLAAYFAYLEEEWGFTRTTIPTDYLFESVDAAVAGVGFFFPHLVEKIKENRWQRVPEWTGIWHRPRA